MSDLPPEINHVTIRNFVTRCMELPQVYWAVFSSDGGGGTFALRTDSACAAGSVVFNNYSSSLDNHRLLMAYGFSLYPNPASSHNVMVRPLTRRALVPEPTGAAFRRVLG